MPEAFGLLLSSFRNEAANLLFFLSWSSKWDWLHPHRGTLLLVTVSTGTSSSGSRFLIGLALPAADQQFPSQGHEEAHGGPEGGKTDRADNIVTENVEKGYQQRATYRAHPGIGICMELIIHMDIPFLRDRFFFNSGLSSSSLPPVLLVCFCFCSLPAGDGNSIKSCVCSLVSRFMRLS